MIAFNTLNYFIFTKKEIWFYNGEEINKATYNVYAAAEQSSGLNLQFLEKYKTTEIDLSKSEYELFNEIHPRHRDYIKTADKKNMSFHSLLQPTEADCRNLIKSFQEMAKSKGINSISQRWLSAVRESGNIYITKMSINNLDIVTHVYIFDKQKVLLTHTFHNINFPDNGLRGEANKLLHWKDILLFKSMQFNFYDFGGINTEKLPGISQFKLKFGGIVKEKYRFVETSNLVYSLIKLFRNIRSN